MQFVRALIHDNRRLALAFVVLAFCIKAVIPAGFMVSTSSDMALTVSICSDASNGIKQMTLAIPRKHQGSGHSDGAQKGGHCAFSGLAKVGVSGADAVLLALAVAFILVFGLAPTKRLPFREAAYLRPPSRGPPATD
ncbi:MAG: hypothetical protein B7Y88_08395 [Sphingomonadales bacterium 32-64-17]|nr:MAG: hypothetical protein B7Y88_08395 [Sphingomonadales bacterium 32-64-17]